MFVADTFAETAADPFAAIGAPAVHALLVAARVPAADPGLAFDGHVLACHLALALDEAARGVATLSEATGLSAATLAALFAHWFPHFPVPEPRLAQARPTMVDVEEELLRDLLLAHAARGHTARGHAGAPDRAEALGAPLDPADLPAILARVVARRAMRPDHLWQDLGLFDRSELSRLLARHFPTLAAGNTANMRWKKYFYRRLCEAEGFSLCSAPSCAVCADFGSCFGAEDGESRLAATRRSLDRAAAVAAE